MSQQINFFFCHNQLVRSAPGPFFFSFLDFLPKHLLMPSLFNYYPHITSEIIHGLEPLNHCVTAQWIPRGKQGPYEDYSSHTIPLHVFPFSILSHSLFINPVFLFTRNCKQDTLPLQEYSFSFGTKY